MSTHDVRELIWICFHVTGVRRPVEVGAAPKTMPTAPVGWLAPSTVKTEVGPTVSTDAVNTGSKVAQLMSVGGTVGPARLAAWACA